MSVALSSPEGMLPDAPYHHVAVGTGTRHVYHAGQVAQALRNVARGLRGAGADFGDVVRLTVYVTDWEPAKIGDFMAGIEAVADEVGLPVPMPPATLIGVQALYEPEVLVEIEATAVVD